MEKIKKLTISIAPWMGFAGGAIGLFMLSYIMAVTMPECAHCGKEQVGFIQLWHGLVSFASLIGAIVMIIVTIVHYCDEG
jgi:hypothetical protein